MEQNINKNNVVWYPTMLNVYLYGIQFYYNKKWETEDDTILAQPT